MSKRAFTTARYSGLLGPLFEEVAESSSSWRAESVGLWRTAEGRYWTAFDRAHPIEGPARAQIWTPTAHALIAELGVGSVTASALQIGLGVAALLAGLGLTFLLTGVGLVWVARAGTESVKAPVLRPAATVV